MDNVVSVELNDAHDSIAATPKVVPSSVSSVSSFASSIDEHVVLHPQDVDSVVIISIDTPVVVTVSAEPRADDTTGMSPSVS